jgi:hypothetical protein
MLVEESHRALNRPCIAAEAVERYHNDHVELARGHVLQHARVFGPVGVIPREPRVLKAVYVLPAFAPNQLAAAPLLLVQAVALAGLLVRRDTAVDGRVKPGREEVLGRV